MSNETRVQEASHLVRKLAEPVPAGDSVKAALLRTSRLLGWSFSRVRACWYQDTRITLADAEMSQLRDAVADRVRDLESQELNNAFREVYRRLARLEQIAILSTENPDRDRLTKSLLSNRRHYRTVE